ncbi:PREDICTED: uncharacterized protein LOC108566606, partial [Nicrophorus vespilloides]|uniref:Uncharacterized protein LOC108566606 n=1 Tax=Nicrophorus vespilloides TaxID=110193 RepID=A0ABM1N5H5_NICVS
MKIQIVLFIVFIVSTRAQSNNTSSTDLMNSEVKDAKFEISGKKILNIFNWFLSSFKSEDSFMGRCIGMARRLKFVMPFLLFKLGVIVTILGFLTLFSMKGLGIGLLLLMINAGGFFGKLASLKSGHDHGQKEYYIPQAPAPAVHLHVHKDGISHGHGYSHGHYEEAPTAWSDRVSQGLSESKTLGEKAELIDLYKRLGFNVNSAINRESTHNDIKKYL